MEAGALAARLHRRPRTRRRNEEVSVPFPHEDEALRESIEATAERFGIAASLVEKDYWVTHAPWSRRLSLPLQ